MCRGVTAKMPKADVIIE